MKTHPLKENGDQVPVTNQNKKGMCRVLGTSVESTYICAKLSKRRFHIKQFFGVVTSLFRAVDVVISVDIDMVASLDVVAAALRIFYPVFACRVRASVRGLSAESLRLPAVPRLLSRLPQRLRLQRSHCT